MLSYNYELDIETKKTYMQFRLSVNEASESVREGGEPSCLYFLLACLCNVKDSVKQVSILKEVLNAPNGFDMVEENRVGCRSCFGVDQWG